MRVVPQGVFAVRGMRSAYPFVSVPPQVVSDYLPASPAGVRGLSADPVTGTVTPPRVNVPWDQTWEEGGVAIPVVGTPYRQPSNPPSDEDRPFAVWRSIAGEAVSLFPLLKMPEKAQGLEARWTGDPATPLENTSLIAICDYVYRRETTYQGQSRTPVTAWASEPLSCQGFTMNVDRSCAQGRDAQGQKAFWQVEFEVGRGSPSRFRVAGDGSSAARLSRQDPGGSWEVVRAELRVPADFTDLTGNKPPRSGGGFPVEAVVLNGRLSISVGGNVSPHVLDLSEAPDEPAITRVVYEASYFSQTGWALHPHCFEDDAAMERDTGYPVSGVGAAVQSQVYGATRADVVGDGQALEHAYPEGSQTTFRQTGESSYSLRATSRHEGTWQERAYALQAAQIPKLNLYRPSQVTYQPGLPIYPIPKVVRETVTFDPNALAVHHSLDVTLDNYYGQYARQSGSVAVQLQLGYSAPAWGNYYRFTGICDTYDFERTRAGAATLTMHCSDLTMMLDQPIGAPPDMDGWNHYWAVAYLLEYCGIPRSAMAFRSLIPDSPFEGAPGDPAAYFLPFGTGMHPWTPRNRILQVRDLIDYLRKPTGFLFYVDAQGYFRYEPWLPSWPGAAVRTFTESATGADGANLTEFWDFRFRTSTRRVRNQVLLVGIDQFSGDWAPIVQKREDPGSIDAPLGVEPFNFVGFRRAFVWVDPRFSNRTFAAESADRLLAILRVPEAVASFTCWMQPDIYPMDVIYVNEYKSGAEGIPFYVLGMTNEYSVPGEAPTSRITGRYLV